MSRFTRLGLLGGSFDPIHLGHLDAADAARAALNLDEILLIPTHDQPLRSNDPRATSFERFALVSLAVADRPVYRVSDIELSRPGPSYTLDTLHALHGHGWRASQLFFILGTDAFAGIADWYGFPSVLDLAQFVVIARPGTSIDVAIAPTPQLRSRTCAASTCVSVNDTQTRIFLVEAHTRDVSSTTIRERLARAQPIDDLVPELVAQYILKHGLYRAVDDLHGKNERI